MTKLVISSGDPAGVGPDICIKAFGLNQKLPYTPIILGDPNLFEERAKKYGFPIKIKEYKGQEESFLSRDFFWMTPFYLKRAVKAGIPDPMSASYMMEMLEFSISSIMKEEFNALITAPINKELINKAGIPFKGHTEVLAELSNTPKVLMMLVSKGLRVALASRHIPIKEVTDFITYDHLKECIQILNLSLKQRWLIKDPHIKVLGLNPHAGEGGFIGKEDKEIILPVIQNLNKKGLKITGPVSADTAFLPKNLKGVDAVLAMYHDQGLPVLKTQGFGYAVNITLGLPFIRTSVDHGTAYEIAGKSEVDESSLLAATEMANKISERCKCD